MRNRKRSCDNPAVDGEWPQPDLVLRRSSNDSPDKAVVLCAASCACAATAPNMPPAVAATVAVAAVSDRD